MKNIDEINNELRRMDSPLADMSRTMPYEVPVGYFDSFMQGVEMLKAGKQMPYDIPKGYFESLAGNVLFEVKKSNDYAMEVPVGYFENLPAEILAKVKQADKKPKTISIGVTVWKNVRFAAAAILLLGVGLGLYHMGFTNRGYNVENELAMISQDELHEYVQQHIDEYEMEMITSGAESFEIKPAATELTKEELQNYLNEGSL